MTPSWQVLLSVGTIHDQDLGSPEKLIKYAPPVVNQDDDEPDNSSRVPSAFRYRKRYPVLFGAAFYGALHVVAGPAKMPSGLMMLAMVSHVGGSSMGKDVP